MHLLQLVLPAISLSGALAAPRDVIQKRDLATIQGSITSVQNALGKLDTAVKALTTDASTAPPILSASQEVEAAIQKATTDITATEPLSLTDAIGLQQVAGGLTTAVQTTIGDLTAKKPILDQLGVTSVALTALQSQKTASKALGDAIVSKVPAIGQGIAQQNVDQVAAILDKGIADLQASGAPGAGAPSSGAGAPGSGAPSSVAGAPGSGAPSSVAGVPSAAPTGAPAGTTKAPSAAPSASAPVASGIPARPSATAPSAPGGGAAPPMGCMCPCSCGCQGAGAIMAA